MQYPKLKIFINLFHALNLSEKAFFTMISRLILGKNVPRLSKEGPGQHVKLFRRLIVLKIFAKFQGKHLTE